MALQVNFTSQFERDVKRLKKRHVDIRPLKAVVDLVAQDTPESLDELRHRHGMHVLRGEWLGSCECHVANAGDWLRIWRANDVEAVFQRTGFHDELFR